MFYVSHGSTINGGVKVWHRFFAVLLNCSKSGSHISIHASKCGSCGLHAIQCMAGPPSVSFFNLHQLLLMAGCNSQQWAHIVQLLSLSWPMIRMQTGIERRGPRVPMHGSCPEPPLPQALRPYILALYHIVGQVPKKAFNPGPQCGPACGWGTSCVGGLPPGGGSAIGAHLSVNSSCFGFFR